MARILWNARAKALAPIGLCRKQNKTKNKQLWKNTNTLCFRYSDRAILTLVFLHALNTLGLFWIEFFLQRDKHGSSHLQDRPYQPIIPAVEASPSLDKLSKKS